MNEYFIEITLDLEDETYESINRYRKEHRRNAKKREYYYLFSEESERTSEEGIFDSGYQTRQNRSRWEEDCLYI